MDGVPYSTPPFVSGQGKKFKDIIGNHTEIVSRGKGDSFGRIADVCIRCPPGYAVGLFETRAVTNNRSVRDFEV